MAPLFTVANLNNIKILLLYLNKTYQNHLL